MRKKTDWVISDNKKARYDYYIIKTYEAGIALTGTEVKSLRAGKANIKDCYAKIKNGEIWLIGSNIEEYEQGNRFNHDPKRSRKLLMHKSEIIKLDNEIKLKSLTLVPLKLYFSGDKVKVELGLAKGKKKYDKLDAEMKKAVEREIEKALKSGLRNY